MPSIVEHTTNRNCRDPREAERASGAAANSTSAALPGAGSSEKEPRRSWFGKVAALGSCKTFWAIAAFLGLSQIMSALQVGALSPQDVPYPTWTSWAISDFMENAQKRPDFVFLGSSLMLVPLDGVDADYTSVALDGSKHHKSIFFEEKFKQYSGEKVDSFNFALPGEMPSDAFLITKFLLRDEHRPHVIVYGVGPRDFMDNLLPSPSATDPFRYLSRFGDYQERITLIDPE